MKEGKRMLNYTLKIGLVPMRRDVPNRPGNFNWEKAEERGRRVVEYIQNNFSGQNISFIDLKGVLEKNIIATEQDATVTGAHFNHEKVDGLLIINCNFGNEEAAALLAKEVNKPVCIWAPMDDEFDGSGMRYTDSQCGIFGVSRQLQRFNLPFSFIESCTVENQSFSKGLRKFLSVACMLKNFHGMRIAQVGTRPKPFCSVIVNEGELVQRFGIQIIPINMAVVINQFNEILETSNPRMDSIQNTLLERYIMDELTPPLLQKIAAFVLLYEWIAETYHVQAISSECWTAMQQGVGAMPCTAFSILADMGHIIACENDVHGAISMALLACASLGTKIPFFGEFTARHPQNPNGELLWHCGPFAYSLKKEGCVCKNVNMRQWFQVKDGQYTVARFDQDDGKYSLLSGVCRSIDGPYTFGTYLWAEFDDLAAWERKLVFGPYIHHMAEIEGDYTGELREFCRFISALNPDCVE